MKKYLPLFILFLFIGNLNAHCPTDGYFYGRTQQLVDSFIIDHPNCTSLTHLSIGDIKSPEKIQSISIYDLSEKLIHQKQNVNSNSYQNSFFSKSTFGGKSFYG